MAVPVYQLLRTLRTYNGSSQSSEVWLQRFETEVADAGKAEKWVIENLDRVLTDKAKYWWSGVSARFENGLTDDNSANRWNQVKAEMNQSFGRDALKESAKLQAKQLKFRIEDDPQEYVYKKLELLALINGNMPQEEKLTYLEAGLPYHIAKMMAIATDDTTTPEQFIKRLRKYLKLENFRNNDKSSNSSNSRGSTSVNTGFNPRFNRMKGKPVDQHQSKVRVCYSCNEPGHISRFFPKKVGQQQSKSVQGQKVNQKLKHNKPHASKSVEVETDPRDHKTGSSSESGN